MISPLLQHYLVFHFHHNHRVFKNLALHRCRYKDELCSNGIAQQGSWFVSLAYPRDSKCPIFYMNSDL